MSLAEPVVTYRRYPSQKDIGDACLETELVSNHSDSFYNASIMLRNNSIYEQQAAGLVYADAGVETPSVEEGDKYDYATRGDNQGDNYDYTRNDGSGDKEKPKTYSYVRKSTVKASDTMDEYSYATRGSTINQPYKETGDNASGGEPEEPRAPPEGANPMTQTTGDSDEGLGALAVYEEIPDYMGRKESNVYATVPEDLLPLQSIFERRK